MFNFGEPKVPQISTDELKRFIDSKEKIIILDVRTAGEYSRGKIEGSVNLPIDDIGENVEKLIPDKQAKIIVYCLSGSRSVYAVDEMVRLGYKKVFNLTNGLLVWRAMNLPLVT